MDRKITTRSQSSIHSLFMCLPFLTFHVIADDTIVTGSLGIDVETQEIRNIIDSASASKAKVNIGGVKQSAINGRSKIDINVNHIRNHIVSGNNNSSIIRLGSIENSDTENATLDIDSDSIKSEIKGGSDNHAAINIGSIRNAQINGHFKSSTLIRSDIENRINGGSGNIADISIGSIEDEYDDSPTADQADSDNIEAQLQQQNTHPINYLSTSMVPGHLLIQKTSFSNQNTLLTPPDQYVIEKRQSSIGDVGGHNFLVLKDPTGKILYELHGLPVDNRTGNVAKKGVSRHHGLRVIEFDRSKGENSHRIKKDQPSAVLFRGNKKQVMTLWERGRKKQKEINKLKIPYPKMGVKLSGGTINSNSVESTLSYAMGLKSPKLKLPLTIQDKAEAIEYDKKPEQSFLFTPGENRIIRP